MNLTVAAALAFLVAVDSVSAIEQHLICKSVHDVFNDEQPQPNATHRGVIQQGRPGKMGPKGEMGEKGAQGIQGPNGIVDYTEINETLQQMFETVTATLLSKIEKLEERIREINDSTQLDCDEGIGYDVKCYFAVLSHVDNRPEAIQLCTDTGGTLANILSPAHQRMIESYLLMSKMRGPRLYLWTVLKFGNSGNDVVTASGQTIANLRWRRGYPNSIEPGVKLNLAQNGDIGLYNYKPDSDAMGALCEKHK